MYVCDVDYADAWTVVMHHLSVDLIRVFLSDRPTVL